MSEIEFPAPRTPPLTAEEREMLRYDDERQSGVNSDRPTGARGELRGLSHADFLELTVEPAHELVEGLVEKATVGTVSGLPDTYKSWLGLALALRVATGGSILGRAVLETGPVGYWWQDDSRENEVRRIQGYARRHGFTDALPLRWHLNEGLRLPDDIPLLRAEIERDEQKIVFLDSLYNFVAGVKLKDEDVAVIFAALKAGICDATGCAVCVVDHAPWPTDANQGQRRAYGSVFKAAAIRWGIYVERTGDSFYVEARGNNLTGLVRTAAVWNAEQLELRLVEPPSMTDELADRLEEFIRRNPGATTTFVRSGVTGKAQAIDDRLASDDRFSNVPPVLFGKPKNSTCWALTEDVPNLLNATLSPNGDDVGTTLPRETDNNPVPAPYTHEVCKGRDGVSGQPCPEDGTML